MSINESTVRGFKKAYYTELSCVKDPDKIITLDHASRGAPLKLGDLMTVQAKTEQNSDIIVHGFLKSWSF